MSLYRKAAKNGNSPTYHSSPMPRQIGWWCIQNLSGNSRKQQTENQENVVLTRWPFVSGFDDFFRFSLQMHLMCPKVHHLLYTHHLPIKPFP